MRQGSKIKHKTHEIRDYQNKTGKITNTETETKTCELDLQTQDKQYREATDLTRDTEGQNIDPTLGMNGNTKVN